MILLISLAVFSGLSLNLILQFALCLRDLAGEEDQPLPFFQAGILFLSVLLAWIVFFYVLSPLGLEFFEYPLLFPLSVLVCFALEHLFAGFSPGVPEGSRSLNPLTAYDGLVMAALCVTLDIALSFAQALALTGGFALGFLLSLFLLKEIRLRSALETVPPFLRGSPLSLISMGLLSLVFSSVAAVLFKVLGVF